MKKIRSMAYLACGVLLGFWLANSSVAAEMLNTLAERSSNSFFVDGQPVTLDAYIIGGHNYVQLRDVGKVVGFNVYWDGTVQVESGKPYTGEAPAKEATPTAAEPIDYSKQANSAVFTGSYTQEVYNALRGAVLTGAGEVKNATEDDKLALMAAEAAAYVYPALDVSGIKIADHAIKVNIRYPATYEEGARVCKAFLSSLTGTDRDKLTAMAAYVCDRLEYDAASTTTPRNLFTEPGVHKGACMSYALGFKFLCDLEGIPCVFVHSEDHQWNEVLVDGMWYAVDLANYDLSYTRGSPGTLLKDPASLKWDPYVQIEPELTRFAKELVAPGSTK